MPSNFLSVDSGFPTFTGEEKTEKKIEVIQNYLFMLVEQLRYALRNIGPENLNGAEMQQWIDGLDIKADAVISNAVITNELYADYGAVAGLTVDRLRTDYQKAKRYLDRDVSPLDYIYIHDEEIGFITADVVQPAQIEQMSVDGRLFWWKDESRTQMTSQKATEWPVYVYRYEEYVKATFRFVRDENGITVPVLTFGVGTGSGDNGKAALRKDTEGFQLVYKTGKGTETGVYLRDDGFTDAAHRRAGVRVDTEAQTITVTPEGTLAEAVTIGYTEDADGNLTLRWPDGKSFPVEVV